MPSRNVSTAYLVQVAELAENLGQLVTYHPRGYRAVLAGPGSGETRIFVLKLARTLVEDVEVPCGATYIIYSQECACKLAHRLGALGLGEASSLFIGTVHRFCLRHLLILYG